MSFGKRRALLSCLLSMLCVSPLACTDDDGGETTVDVADTSEEETSNADATADTEQDTSEGDTEAETDVEPEGCADFQGLFRGTTTSCSGGVFPNLICVQQTDCELTVTTGSLTLTGTATQNSATVSSLLGSCDLTLEGSGNVVASCNFGGSVCNGISVPIDTDGNRACCDVIAQDCGEGQRCQRAVYDEQPTTVCIPEAGSQEVGESCTRSDTTGFDDCVGGGFCFAMGTATTEETQCQQHCVNSGQCPEGSSCIFLGGFPLTGTCTPICSPFTEPSCSNGRCNSVLGLDAEGRPTSTTGCFPSSGETALGDPCTNPSVCVDGAFCRFGECQAACDDNNACEGTNCVALENPAVPLPDGLGSCE